MFRMRLRCFGVGDVDGAGWQDEQGGRAAFPGNLDGLGLQAAADELPVKIAYLLLRIAP